jgi:hypothetical protein
MTPVHPRTSDLHPYDADGHWHRREVKREQLSREWAAQVGATKGVSRTYMYYAKYVSRHCADLAAQVESGQMPLYLAYRTCVVRSREAPPILEEAEREARHE